MHSLAQTTCETKNCKITITIKIAFMSDPGEHERLSGTGGVYDDGLKGKLEDTMGDMSEMNELDMLALQMMMQKQAQIMQTFSAIMKNMHDTMKSIIQNLK